MEHANRPSRAEADQHRPRGVLRGRVRVGEADQPAARRGAFIPDGAFARPYYICAALTADMLAPVRGLMAISTWAMERRVIGSLSPRVDFLTAAIQVAAAVDRLPSSVPAASRLMWRFAASIPGAAQHAEPRTITDAALAELRVHEAADQATRKDSATRARNRLDDAEQLFGTRLHMTRGSTKRSGN